MGLTIIVPTKVTSGAITTMLLTQHTHVHTHTCTQMHVYTEYSNTYTHTTHVTQQMYHHSCPHACTHAHPLWHFLLERNLLFTFKRQRVRELSSAGSLPKCCNILGWANPGLELETQSQPAVWVAGNQVCESSPRGRSGAGTRPRPSTRRCSHLNC